jgi:hypothetical protein
MNHENAARRDAPVGRWIWALPLAYALHVIEEAYGGRGLVEWMILAVAAGGARIRPSWRWTLASAGTILLVNGVCHVAASVATRYYVPGMWTGLAFYIPLGAVLLFRARRLVRPGIFRAAVAVGFVIHAAVLWVVFGAPGL